MSVVAGGTEGFSVSLSCVVTLPVLAPETPGAWHLAPGTWHLAPGAGCQVLVVGGRWLWWLRARCRKVAIWARVTGWSGQ